jgi:hypothetical protein
MWWATIIESEPTIAKLIANCACQDVVRISYRPLWPSPVKGPLWASKISFILWPIPQFVRYIWPATRNITAIAKWWCAVSLNHKPPVSGFKPPRNVRKSEYSAQLRVKNGATPFEKLGYSWAINSLFSKNSWGSGISLGSTPASRSLFTGSEMWIWWPAQDKLPKPSKPAKWWFSIDSTFWNHSSFGAALW